LPFMGSVLRLFLLMFLHIALNGDSATYLTASSGFVNCLGFTIMDVTPALFAARVSVNIWSPINAQTSFVNPVCSMASSTHFGEGLRASIFMPMSSSWANAHTLCFFRLFEIMYVIMPDLWISSNHCVTCGAGICSLYAAMVLSKSSIKNLIPCLVKNFAEMSVISLNE